MPSWMEVFGFVTGAASVGLLIAKGTYVTSGPYLVYQVLCAMGLLEWRRALQREATSSAG